MKIYVMQYGRLRRVNNLGSKQTRRKWTEEELEYLHDHYKTHGDEEIAGVLGRTEQAVKRKRSIEGLIRSAVRKWTKKELMELSTLYQEGKNDKEIGEALGRTTKAIENQRSALGMSRLSGLKEAEYALYEGDDYIAGGTLEEISEQTNLTVRTLGNYRYPSYRKRTNKELVRID